MFVHRKIASGNDHNRGRSPAPTIQNAGLASNADEESRLDNSVGIIMNHKLHYHNLSETPKHFDHVPKAKDDEDSAMRSSLTDLSINLQSCLDDLAVSQLSIEGEEAAFFGTDTDCQTAPALATEDASVLISKPNTEMAVPILRHGEGKRNDLDQHPLSTEDFVTPTKKNMTFIGLEQELPPPFTSGFAEHLLKLAKTMDQVEDIDGEPLESKPLSVNSSIGGNPKPRWSMGMRMMAAKVIALLVVCCGLCRRWGRWHQGDKKQDVNEASLEMISLEVLSETCLFEPDYKHGVQGACSYSDFIGYFPIDNSWQLQSNDSTYKQMENDWLTTNPEINSVSLTGMGTGVDWGYPLVMILLIVTMFTLFHFVRQELRGKSVEGENPPAVIMEQPIKETTPSSKQEKLAGQLKEINRLCDFLKQCGSHLERKGRKSSSKSSKLASQSNGKVDLANYEKLTKQDLVSILDAFGVRSPARHRKGDLVRTLVSVYRSELEGKPQSHIQQILDVKGLASPDLAPKHVLIDMALEAGF